MPSQCGPLLTAKPYDPCPWVEATPEDNLLHCTDGTSHYIDPNNIITWEACGHHGFRSQCPRNYPVMCDTRGCLGDHCCEASVEDCEAGPRPCSEALKVDLQEWRGLLTPQKILSMVTTTTMDPLEALLLITRTTTMPVGPAKVMQDIMPWAFLAIGITAVVCGIFICIKLGKTHYLVISKTRVGVPLVLFKLRAGEVFKIAPEKSSAPQDPLPPIISHHEVRKQREDRAAIKELGDSVLAAEYMVPVQRANIVQPRAPAPKEETALRTAVQVIEERKLTMRGKVPDFLRRADAWIRAVDAERYLLIEEERLRPLYGHMNDKGYHSEVAPVIGLPWKVTLHGINEENEKRRAKFDEVEKLGEAIKGAAAAGANENMLAQVSELYRHLVAQIHELPSERCVLDPEGEGIKLLPLGTNRAVWVTGEVYCFKPETGEADELGEPPPPAETLGDVSVDDARPVCAEFAEKGTCKQGRRCPWRHAKPKPGDIIRECIFFGEP